MKKQKSLALRLVMGFMMLIAAVAALLPFIYMVLVSLTQKQILDMNFNPAEFSFINYERVFRNFNLLQNFGNSLIVTGGTCLLDCCVSSLAAYAFAKLPFPGRSKLFAVYLATMMIPGQVTLIPVFTMLKSVGLLNTYAAMIFPCVGAFGVFLIRQFMVGLPDDLLEAARIDGCGENRIFLSIVVPLIKPVLLSLVIFTFISSWSGFLWPLIVLTKPEMKTLTLALSALQGNYSTNYGLVMAGSAVTFLPPFLLYIVLQKQFVQGIALSGIKG